MDNKIGNLLRVGHAGMHGSTVGGTMEILGLNHVVTYYANGI